MNQQSASPMQHLFEHLRRPDVAELALASGRLPCVRVGGAFAPIDPGRMTKEAILEILVALGGSRHVDALAEKPVQWKLRMEGIGMVAVAALRRGDDVQARFAVTERDPASSSLRAAPASASLQVAPASAGLRAAPASAGLRAAPVVVPPAAPASAKAVATAGEFELDLDRDATPVAPPPEPPPRLTLDTSTKSSFDLNLAPPGTKSLGPLTLDQGGGPIGTGPRSAAEAIDAALDMPEPPGPATPLPHRAAPILPFDGTMESLLKAARAGNASDMHLVSDRPLLLRIGGDLTPHGDPLAAAALEPLILAQIPERIRPSLEKDGSCDFALEHWSFGRFRVNVTRQRTGLKACYRLIPDRVPTLEELGLPDAIAAATHHHQGLIILTGPTGHGKTTTLAALVDLINRETTHHVITVEDPVEFIHPRKKAMMSQREVGTHTRSFRAALKGSLREDPDVIVIGELRDTETVRIALSASETGHLVIGTMNTPSAAKTIDRLIDLFPPGDQQQVRMTLAGGLKLVVSQRLVPNADKTGLFAAAEVLPGSVALWNLIRDNKTFQIPSLQQRGKGLGIVRLDDSLADLVRSGKTTLEQVLPFAEAPDDLAAKVAAGRAAAPAAGAPGAPAPAADKGQVSPAGAKAGLLGKAGSIFGKKG